MDAGIIVDRVGAPSGSKTGQKLSQLVGVFKFKMNGGTITCDIGILSEGEGL
jgi:hypothetical protein